MNYLELIFNPDFTLESRLGPFTNIESRCPSEFMEAGFELESLPAMIKPAKFVAWHKLIAPYPH